MESFDRLENLIGVCIRDFKYASRIGDVERKENALNGIADTAAMLVIAARLEYLRQELRAERISSGELAELQSLAEHIEPGDVELLEAAGEPENL